MPTVGIAHSITLLPPYPRVSRDHLPVNQSNLTLVTGSAAGSGGAHTETLQTRSPDWERVEDRPPSSLLWVSFSPRDQSSHTWSLGPDRVCPVLRPPHLCFPGGRELGLPALWAMLLSFSKAQSSHQDEGPSIFSSTVGEGCMRLPLPAFLARKSRRRWEACTRALQNILSRSAPPGTCLTRGYCIPSPEGRTTGPTLQPKCRGPATEPEAPGFNRRPDRTVRSLGYRVSKTETPCLVELTF